MAFLIILIALLISTVVVLFAFEDELLYFSFSLSVIMPIVSIIAAATLLCIPFNRIHQKAFIQEIEAFKVTVSESRDGGSEIENASILSDISCINMKLARLKYLNSTFIGDVFVVDEIDDIPYLK